MECSNAWQSAMGSIQPFFSTLPNKTANLWFWMHFSCESVWVRFFVIEHGQTILTPILPIIHTDYYWRGWEISKCNRWAKIPDAFPEVKFRATPECCNWPPTTKIKVGGAFFRPRRWNVETGKILISKNQGSFQSVLTDKIFFSNTIGF